MMDYVEHSFEVDRSVLRKLRALCEPSDAAAIRAIAFDYLVISASIYATVAISHWFYPVALVLIGSTQRAFVNLLHETVHGTLAKNPVLNFVGGTVLSSYLVFHLYSPYRNSHVGLHHRHFGDEERDPDYNFHLMCGLYETDESHRVFVAKNLILSLVGYRTIPYLRYVLRDRILFSKEKLVIRTSISVLADRALFFSTWIVALSAIAYFDVWRGFLLFWIVPCFTTSIAIGWCTELAEHYPLPQSENKRLLMTRNRHGWLIERFLFGRHHDNYHLVHHIYPAVPFHNLRKAHLVLREDGAYRQWDDVWGGIFTRNSPSEETLMTYIRKYRSARTKGLSEDASTSFAERFIGHRRAAPTA